MSHAFVSYVREDQRQVDRMCTELNRYGVETWTDRSSLIPGQRWRDAIRRAIRDGAAFIACFSPQFVERSRTYMHEELNIAIGELRMRPNTAIWFIPILLGQCDVPDIEIRPGETLQDIQHVRLDRDWQAGIRSILQAISELSGGLLNFDQAEKFDRFIEALEELRSKTDLLWHEVSERTIAEYGLALQKALTQVARASVVFDSEDIGRIEGLLTSSFDFRVGKERLLEMRARENSVSEETIAEIQWQIGRNKINRDEFTSVLEQLKSRHIRLK